MEQDTFQSMFFRLHAFALAIFTMGMAYGIYKILDSSDQVDTLKRQILAIVMFNVFIAITLLIHLAIYQIRDWRAHETNYF